MYRFNKLPLCTQIVKKYYNDGPRLILVSKSYKWQNREVNSKACFPRKCDVKTVCHRYQDGRVGLYLAAQCLYWQGRSASTCNDKPRQKPEEEKKGVLYYTLGFMLVGTAATIAYAETDPEFREWLDARVPGTNELIKVIYKEEKPYGESFDEYKDKLKTILIAKIQQMMKKQPAKKEEQSKDDGLPIVEETQIEQCLYKPPVPAFGHMQKQAGKDDQHFTERRLISEKSEIIPLEDTIRPESDGAAYSNLPETHPLNLLELEKKIGDSAEKAICTYVTAIQALREYSKEMYPLVDQAFKNPNPDIWDKLKTKAEEKHQLIEKAEKEVKAALDNIERLRKLIENPDVDASEVIKERVRKNIQRVVLDVGEAKKRFEKEADALSVTQKFWKKVEDVRKFFNDDLIVLFPKMRTSEKQLKMNDEEIGLLLSHLYQSILYYQKEYSKVDNVRTVKFKQTLEALQSGKANVVDAMMEAELEKLQRTLVLDDEKKELAVKSGFEKMNRALLVRQLEEQKEYRKELLAWKEVEAERRLLNGLDDKLDEIKSNFKLEVAAMTGRMKGFNVDEKTKPKGDQNQQQAQAQVLWSACQALLTAMNAATNNRPWTQQLHPLQAEISAIVKAADEKDELVKSVVDTIPKKAINRGIYSKDALKERFIKVKQLATRLAQVSDGGASAFLLLLSMVQSFLICKKGDPISSEEIANEPIDPAEFTTYDILQRAKYWLERDDFDLTIRYMNLLKGAPKSIAKDWIEEAITFLETQQAADTLLAHASSTL